MSLDAVRRQLAGAEVAEVAGVFGGPNRANAAIEAGVAEVAEVPAGPVGSVSGDGMHRLQGSCIGFSSTHARASAGSEDASEGSAEVAGVFHSFTRARSHAHARAREVELDGKPLQPMRPMHRPSPATILRHCRCADCLNFECVGGEYFCSEGIGGTSVVWATGKRQCDPPPDAWHYCACYHGRQISQDIWVWPQGQADTPRSATDATTPKPAEPTPTTPSPDVGQPDAAGGNVADTPKQLRLTSTASDVNGSFPAGYEGDRDGNGRQESYCLLRAKTPA
jgi:hypothetical protein